MPFFGSDWIDKSQSEVVQIHVELPKDVFTGHEVEKILVKIQQAILNNQRDALQDKNYAVEYFRKNF